MSGQGVKRWHFADPVVPCRRPPHRPDTASTDRNIDASSQVPPPQPSTPAHENRGPSPHPSAKKPGKCRPPVARDADTGRPLRPLLAEKDVLD